MLGGQTEGGGNETCMYIQTLCECEMNNGAYVFGIVVVRTRSYLPKRPDSMLRKTKVTSGEGEGGDGFGVERRP